MNIKQLEKLKDDLTVRLADVKEQIAEIKRREKEEKRRRGTYDHREIVARVLRGDESVTDIAKSLGVTPPGVQIKLQRLCRRANPEIYEAGIKHGSTNNYRTPPLQYLRDNKRAFGF